MTPDDQIDLDAANEGLNRMMDRAQAQTSVTVEAIKLRIASQERLLILNASVLALTFSAVTAYHAQHPQIASAVSSLIHSWQLFLVAIVASLLSNWSSVNGAIHYSNYTHSEQIGVSFDQYEMALRKILPDYAKKASADWETDKRKYSKSSTYHAVFFRLAGGLGFLAQVGTCWGLFCLYQFAKAILTS
jgi:hypothetical protein